MEPSSSSLSPFLGRTSVKLMSDPKYYVFEKDIECAIEELVKETDSFSVELLPEMEEIFEVKGKVLSFEGEKFLEDKNGQKLFTMTTDITSTLYNMYVRDLRTKMLYTVRKKSIIPGMGRGTLEVLPGRESDAAPMILIDADISKSLAVVKDLVNEKDIAIIQRSTMTKKKIFAGLDSYQIKVAAGTDLALIVMFTVCFDEQYTEGLA